MLAGLILLIFATIWLRSLVQPQSRGHTIEFWVQRYNDSRLTGLGAEEAQSAIRGIGTNGLPALLSMLEAKDPWWKPKLTEFLTKQLRLKVRVKSAQTKNWQAAAAYEVLGDTAAPQVPQLISLLEKTSDPYRRNFVAAALGFIGPSARPAIPALVRSTRDQHRGLRSNSYLALSRIHGDPMQVVPVMVAGLNDSDFTARQSAISCLSYYGRHASNALPALAAAAKTNSHAITAFHQIMNDMAAHTSPTPQDD
jgi:hypothetical protein